MSPPYSKLNVHQSTLKGLMHVHLPSTPAPDFFWIIRRNQVETSVSYRLGSEINPIVSGQAVILMHTGCAWSTRWATSPELICSLTTSNDAVAVQHFPVE